MIEWIELNEEDERFIDNPGFSEDQEPDPELADMFWSEIVEELDFLEREAWEEHRASQYLYEQEILAMQEMRFYGENDYDPWRGEY